MLVDTGLYVKGTNSAIDEALARYPAILQFLRQDHDEGENLASTSTKLAQLERTA
jgi:flagellum-specific ATP synthase